MRDGLPGAVVKALAALFAASLLALLAWFVYFASTIGTFWDRFGAGQALLITAALSGGVALSSGLLTLHYRSEGVYSGGEEVVFRASLMVSTGVLLCSGIWAAAIFLLG